MSGDWMESDPVGPGGPPAGEGAPPIGDNGWQQPPQGLLPYASPEIIASQPVDAIASACLGALGKAFGSCTTADS